MDDSNRPTFDFSGDGSGGGAAPQAVPGQDIVAQQPGNNEDRGGYKGVHPIAALFHVTFKAGALLTYILGGVFSAGYIIKFVITVLCCAADFWVVKNVTGRILVALRWWNEVKEDGSTQWVFESAPEGDSGRVNAYDSWFFWVTQGVYTAAWLFLGIFSLLSFSNWPMLIAGFMLAGANLLGYVKCHRDAKSRITRFMMSQAANRPETVAAAARVMTGGGASTQ